MNFLRGRLAGDGLDLGGVHVGLPPAVRARVTPGAAEVLVGLRPECFLPAGAAGGLLQGEVEVVEQLGAESYLYLRIPGLDVVEQSDRPEELTGSICARLNEAVDIKTGDRLALDLRPELLRLFDEKTGISRLNAG
jgi:multiple sugar transport system ATP-binding protein